MLGRTVQYIDIASIEQSDELQARLELDQEVIRDYATDFAGGAIFPPILVFHDGARNWLADGFHRVAARKLLEKDTILAEVRCGTREDAIWCSIAANKAHGLRRTNSDKRRAVERALLHPRSQRLSNRQIANHCGVHHHTVGRIRSELEESNTIDITTTREVVRAGATYTQSVAGIGIANRERCAVLPVVKAPADHILLAREHGRRKVGQSAAVSHANTAPPQVAHATYVYPAESQPDRQSELLDEAQAPAEVNRTSLVRAKTLLVEARECMQSSLQQASHNQEDQPLTQQLSQISAQLDATTCDLEYILRRVTLG